MGTQLPPKRGVKQLPLFGVGYFGQMAGWIKMPLGTEVNLGPGHTVLHGNPATPKRDMPPIFGPCLLWPNTCQSQLLLSTCSIRKLERETEKYS